MSAAPDSNPIERKSNLLRNLLLVYAVSILDLVLSLLINLLIPKIASKDDFANYRRLVLYASYAGFFHLGLLNGIYLYVVGKGKHEIDWNLLSTAKRFLLFLQLIVLSLALGAVLVTMPSGSARLIISLSVASWGILNFITFYNYLFQGINRFVVFSLVNLSAKSVSVVIVAYVVSASMVSTNTLIIIFTIPPLLTLIIYEIVWTTSIRGLTTVSPAPLLRQQVSLCWRRGLILQVANVCILLLFSIDNLAVSLLFGASEFATYSFAYGLTTVIYVAVDGLTAVATPYLAKNLRTLYAADPVNHVYLAALWFVPLSFWPAAALIKYFFLQYLDAIPLLLLFSASLPFNILVRSRVVAIATATGRERFLLQLAVPGFLFTFACVATAYLKSHSIYAIALSWTLAVILTAIASIVAVNRISPDPAHFGYRLAWNAAAATLLYAFCATSGPGIQFALLYFLAASIGFGLNSYYLHTHIL